MPGLPATGELTYNGYTFDGASKITVNIEFVSDDVGRTIIAHKHTIEVEAIIANDASNGLDSDMLDIRKRLGADGKALTFRNKGFGDDLVITPPTSPKQDVMRGPTPEFLSWVPIGDDKAAQIAWRVSVTVPICETTPRHVGIMALNYSVSYRIDEHGDTTRVLSGYIQIAQRAGPVASDTADAYRNFFAPIGLVGFERQQQWDVSPDKSRVTFTITDTQVKSFNAYPAQITAIEGTHRVSWQSLGGNSAKFRNTISMRITPEAGLSGAQAWVVFLQTVTLRLRRAQARGREPFLLSLEIEENLYGRPQAFQASYRLLSCLTDIVGDSGLWQPLGNDWRVWRVSMNSSQLNNRGHARLRDVAANDAVISLCEPQKIVSPNNRQLVSQFVSSFRSALVNGRPSPDKSWLEYESVCIPYRERPTVRQPIIQPEEPDTPTWELDTGIPPADFSFSTPTSVTEDEIQVGGANRYGVRYCGKAQRAGHQIARPAVKRIGTETAVETEGKFMQRTVGNFFGVPVYEAMWDINYITEKSPGLLRPPNDLPEWVNARNNRIEAP